jgi:hypothetical protein
MARINQVGDAEKIKKTKVDSLKSRLGEIIIEDYNNMMSLSADKLKKYIKNGDTSVEGLLYRYFLEKH